MFHHHCHRSVILAACLEKSKSQQKVRPLYYGIRNSLGNDLKNWEKQEQKSKISGATVGTIVVFSSSKSSFLAENQAFQAQNFKKINLSSSTVLCLDFRA